MQPTPAQREVTIAASFDSVATREMRHFRPSTVIEHEDWMPKYGIPAGWQKTVKSQDGTHSVNVERTQSLTTPYIGTNRFTVTIATSERFNLKEDAEAATPNSTSPCEHLHTYGYQSGRWVLTSEQHRYLQDGTWSIWGDCVGEIW
jgi:hypothetical protein